MKKIMAALLAGAGVFALEIPENMGVMEVTAAGIPANQDTMGQHVEVLSREDLERRRPGNLTDALQDIAGLNLKSYGPRDSNASISFRGMARYHTRFLVDGVPFMDNSGTQPLPVIGNISLEDVERVEVLKGVSSLQGSAAMGGIVNLVTRQPEQEGIHGRISLEGGSHARIKSGAVLEGRGEDWFFNLSAVRERERGISAVRHDGYGSVNMDNDHYRDSVYSGKAGIQLDGEWRLELGGRFQEIDEEYDAGYSFGDFVARDTDDVYVRRSMGYGKLIGEGLFGGKLDTLFSYGITRMDRAYLNRDRTEYRYIGDTDIMQWRGTVNIDDRNQVTLGVERESSNARNIEFRKKVLDKGDRINGAYIAYMTEPAENLFFNFNGRYTWHSRFHGEWTGDAALKYYVEKTGTTFKGSLGKGYRAPGIYELYAQAAYGFVGGNPDLKPETCISWEAGIEQKLPLPGLEAGVSYYENDVDDLISSGTNADGLRYFTQIRGVSIRGAESYAAWKASDNLNFRISHIYQRARDVDTGNKHIAYIPRHSAVFSANWSPLDWLDLNLGGSWTGNRMTDSAPRKKLDSFLLMHTAITCRINSSLQVYGRIENLLNTRYTLSEDFGTQYNTYGRCYYVGLVYRF